MLFLHSQDVCWPPLARDRLAQATRRSVFQLAVGRGVGCSSRKCSSALALRALGRSPALSLRAIAVAMPRAFLFTHRRYTDMPPAALHPPPPCSDEVTEHGVEADCPDELYNLTQLAEVSLAAAAADGHVFASDLPSQRAAEPAPEQGNHRCQSCGKRYSTSSNLARHRQTHRSLDDKKARRCPHPACGKLYVSMPAFSMHLRTHNQACRCPSCGKCFSRPWLLQGHLRTHTGEKPFKCVECGKAFADKSNLRAHVQTHSGSKPYSCCRCGKAFALKSYLYKHEESSCVRNTSAVGNAGARLLVLAGNLTHKLCN